MIFRVELIEAATETPRGFLGVEDDENPNSNIKVAQYDSEDEAQDAIMAEIRSDRVDVRDYAFMVIDSDGLVYGTTYYDEVYKTWSTFD